MAASSISSASASSNLALGNEPAPAPSVASGNLNSQVAAPSELLGGLAPANDTYVQGGKTAQISQQGPYQQKVAVTQAAVAQKQNVSRHSVHRGKHIAAFLGFGTAAVGGWIVGPLAYTGHIAPAKYTINVAIATLAGAGLATLATVYAASNLGRGSARPNGLRKHTISDLGICDAKQSEQVVQGLKNDGWLHRGRQRSLARGLPSPAQIHKACPKAGLSLQQAQDVAEVLAITANLPGEPNAASALASQPSALA